MIPHGFRAGTYEIEPGTVIECVDRQWCDWEVITPSGGRGSGADLAVALRDAGALKRRGVLTELEAAAEAANRRLEDARKSGALR